MTDSLLKLEPLVEKWAKAVLSKHRQSPGGREYPNSTYNVCGRRDASTNYDCKKPNVVVSDVVYKPHRPIALPGLTFTDWSDNETSETLTTNFNKSEKMTNTRTTTVTVGIEVGFSIESSVDIEVASYKMSFNTKISTSSTESQTTTKEDSWSVDKTVLVPAMKSVEMIWSIGEQKLDIDFTADVTLSGEVYVNAWGDNHSYYQSRSFARFFEELKEYDIPYPSASNIKYVGPDKQDVQFTLNGTLVGQNAVESVFRAVECPLRPPPDP